jgi:hypothetical protein
MRVKKKPVSVDAVQFIGSNEAEVRAFCPVFRYSGALDAFVIPTLEGEHVCSVGDFVIKGIKGEFYPCKPDIFAATYTVEAETVDQAHARLGHTAPRVTPADINDNIVGEVYFTAAQGARMAAMDLANSTTD